MPRPMPVLLDRPRALRRHSQVFFAPELIGRSMRTGSVRKQLEHNLLNRAATKDAAPTSLAAAKGVKASRFAQLSRGLQLTAVAALFASVAGLVHLVTSLAAVQRRSWWMFWQSQQNAEPLVALSTFLSAHPLEYPGLLFATGGVVRACEAARRVGFSKYYRSLYVSLTVAGLSSILDSSALTQQTLVLGKLGSTGILFWLSFAGYVAAVWLSGVVNFSEVIIGGRAFLGSGLPGTWKSARSSSLLPRLYAVAEAMCIFEVLRSPLWRAGRLLPVLAALDDLRRASAKPELLSSPEASQLTKAANFWASSSLLEAALLGTVCASWARQLGAAGVAAATTGLVAALVAALPAASVLLATFLGWSRSEAELHRLTKVRSRRRRRLGRYDLRALETMYMKSLACFYEGFYPAAAISVVTEEDAIDDSEYYRLKVRLRRAGSGLLELDRHALREHVQTTAAATKDEETQTDTDITGAGDA
eukprot:TRINITY_DN23834_c0_g1_i2.p1 TRINITY_DN23834_c0_g1~~TRINITY_DN23834_c0_g1_i2.p1  ORF type:complete len:494 (+),score=102.07 TRINITY_DN23834_c0_g1_i2:56-1483(+)